MRFLKRLFLFVILVIATVIAFAGIRHGRQTALFSSAKDGKISKARVALALGANPNAEQMERTPLAIAAENGYVEIVKAMIDHGADVRAQSRNANAWGNPLIWAAINGHDSVVRLLFASGAGEDPEKVKNIFLLAVHNAKSGQGLKPFLERGVDVNMTYGTATESITPLCVAAAREHPETVRFFLQNGADMRNGRYNALLCSEAQDYSPPHGSYYHDDAHPKSTKVLIDRGAVVNEKDSHGRTALIYAAMHSHTEDVRALLEHGADALVRDDNGKTARDWTPARGEGIRWMLLSTEKSQRTRMLRLVIAPIRRSGANVTLRWHMENPLPGGEYQFTVLFDKGTGPCDGRVEDAFRLKTRTRFSLNLYEHQYVDGEWVSFAISVTDSSGNTLCQEGSSFPVAN